MSYQHTKFGQTLVETELKEETFYFYSYRGLSIPNNTLIYTVIYIL